MRGHCIIYFFNFLVFWTSLLTHVLGEKNEKNQQTFVVRYKNGDQTIPVTVVIDDKKQTEYVINMSPRTLDKSVTLYDFKQRTIAYKDLTNKECFLGRLTDETLKQEIDTLSDVKNPIEGSPKILSLAPHRSALTPTEIRNIAGQKTAVFCRKMNTWLIRADEGHTIFKRDVDEVEERTYKHHGFHTVHFSRYGQETRRRYRKPTSSQSVHKEKHSFDKENENHEYVEPTKILDDTLSTDTSTKVNHDHLRKEEPFPYGTSYEAKQNLKDESNSEFSPKFPDFLTANNHHFHPRNYEDLFDDSLILENKTNNREDNLYSKPGIIVNSSGTKYEHPSASDPFFHPSSFQHLEIKENETNSPENQNVQYPHLSEKRNIESEAHLPGDNPLPKIYSPTNSISDHHTENPDFSINIFEKPKTTNKFQALDHSQEYSQKFVQPNEDFHAIFENFHNLQENDRPTEIDDFDNTKHISIEFDQNSDPLILTTQKSLEADDFLLEYTIDTTTTIPFIEPLKNTNPNNSIVFNNKYDSLLKIRNATKIDNYQTSEVKTPFEHDSFDNILLNNKPNHFQPILINTKSYLTSNNDNRFPKLYEQNSSFDDNRDYIDNKDNTNMQSNSLHISHPVIQEDIAPNQLRFQNILRNYQPDEIIIDIEKIPTERPPDSTSKFRGKIHKYVPNENSFLNPNLENQNSKAKYIPRTNLIKNISYPGTRIKNDQNPIRNRADFSREKSALSSHLRNGMRKPLLPSYNTMNQFNSRLRQNSLSFYNQPYRLDNLPPGVSLHPRHPQAPYANMLQTNALQTLPHISNVKSHRQRHHRKKDRGNCCKSNGRLLACCSWNDKIGKPSSGKHSKSMEFRQTLLQQNGNMIPQISVRKENLPLNEPNLRDSYIPSGRKTSDHKKGSRCLREKMCRTLYESTQQVIVCRNANIEGC